MSTELTTRNTNALELSDDELIPVLQSSLYPGAKPASIKLVLGYCKAAGLDPMQKPVHIVPMRVKQPNGDYEWRDTIMPGISLYRVQAARTGELAGIDEPEFGPMKQGLGIEYPEWCKVTAYRIIGGMRVPFTSCEYWLENYATEKKDSVAPNTMWRRRPRGQIAKCAEAQALRKAFPELGSQPTADETIVDISDAIEVRNPQRAAIEQAPNPWTDELKQSAHAAASRGMTAYTQWWKEQNELFRTDAVKTNEHAKYKELAAKSDKEPEDIGEAA